METKFKLMNYYQLIEKPSKRLIIFMVGFLFLLMNNLVANAQSIDVLQNIEFGTFIPYGSGGSITINPDNNFSTSGSIILKGRPSRATISYNYKQNHTINVSYDKNVTLTRAQGETLSLVLSNNKSSNSSSWTFDTWKNDYVINFGGTLTIGSSSITNDGTYIGSFEVNFTVIH